MWLSPATFNGLLANMGQRVAWRRAYLCPCRDTYSGAPVPGCPQCRGKGTLWAEAVDAWTGLAGMKVAREWAAFTQWESGDVVLTIPSDSPLYAAGENDRIVMSQSSEPFSIALTRGTLDRVTFPVLQVDRVFWLTDDLAATIEAGIPTVAPDGTLTWTESAPPDGKQYSVTGRKRQEYYVFKDLPQDRAHHGGATLPRRVVARRFDLAGR